MTDYSDILKLQRRKTIKTSNIERKYKKCFTERRKEEFYNMIYTVTCNPSLDYIVSVEDFKLGMTNRTSREQMLPGGKGINVSIVLRNLGVESTAFGFLAGFVGAEIQRRMEETGCVTDFIPLEEGNSRINVKLRSIDGTEINGQGPDISKQKVEELFAKMDKLKEGDVLVLAVCFNTIHF